MSESRLQRHMTIDGFGAARIVAGQKVHFTLPQQINMLSGAVQEVIRVDSETWNLVIDQTPGPAIIRRVDEVCVDFQKAQIVHGEHLCRVGRDLITRGTILKKKGLGLIPPETEAYHGEQS